MTKLQLLLYIPALLVFLGNTFHGNPEKVKSDFENLRVHFQKADLPLHTKWAENKSKDTKAIPLTEEQLDILGIKHVRYSRMGPSDYYPVVQFIPEPGLTALILEERIPFGKTGTYRLFLFDQDGKRIAQHHLSTEFEISRSKKVKVVKQVNGTVEYHTLELKPNLHKKQSPNSKSKLASQGGMAML